MKKLLTLLLLAAVPVAGTRAQEVEMTTAQAKTMYKNTTKRATSVHDPSVVYEPSSKRYYVFGSHKAGAYTTDLQNWTWAPPTWQVGSNTNAANKDAFVTPAVKKVPKGGEEKDLPQFNAEEWSHRTQSDYNIDGNMWAPDVIWNPTMEKWCMYLSINGDAWHSSIILLTSDNITGPYEYQGPVVICGFDNGSHSFKGTDLELVLGTMSTLPSRYTAYWGNRWPHTIDPAAFYDEEGKLWLVYGSWSGGIWMLELNEANGLRDYDVTYPSTNGNSDNVTSDPYFGTKIAGGHYVSGEGPYIEHIGDYYYLFVSYGFYSPDGGYEMRIFRSKNPNGPYVDGASRSAIFTAGGKNYGNGTETRGEKIMGAYNNWGFMTVGECAQGHNSIIAAADGRTYLVYHTKFNNGTAGHSVRVHQVFQNKLGWLVAAPFEYNGEDIVSADVAQKQLVAADDIPGTYQLIVHKYAMDYAHMEEVTPVEISLNADGTISGSRSGKWSLEEGTSYVKITLGSTPYNGVIFEEQMDGKSIKTVSFTAMANGGVNIWGYKMRDDYSLAWQLNNQTVPLTNNQRVNRNYDLYAIDTNTPNVKVTWTTDQPDVISEYGRYYPIGLTENVDVTLTVYEQAGRYFWQQTFKVKAQSEEASKTTNTTWSNNMLAHYEFDDANLVNSLNAAEKAELLKNGTAKLPTLEDGDVLRNGNVVHNSFGAKGKESYVAVPNPLKGKDLANGATISFFVKRTDNNLYDALFGMTDGKANLYLTGNLYFGYNNGLGSYIDINHPSSVQPEDLTVGRWHLVTITFDRKVTTTSGGVTIYVDGVAHKNDRYATKVDDKEATTRQSFNYNLLLDNMATFDKLYLGYGSFWGSADAAFDDLIVYDRVLSLLEISALNQMINRSNVSGKTGISDMMAEKNPIDDGAVYDLSGRRVTELRPGLYIRNGKKFIVK